MAKSTRTPSVHKLAQQRELAIAAMSEPLREVFNAIEMQLDDLKSQNILQYHRLGALLSQVRAEPERFATLDGSAGDVLLTRALNMDKRSLRFAAHFYNSYNEEQLRELLELRNADTNYRLSFAHVKYLLTVVNVVDRSSYAAKAVVESLAPQELHDYIKRQENRDGGHGRTHHLPVSLTAQLQQILSLAEKFVSKQETVWNGQNVSVFSNIRTASDDLLDADHVEILTQISAAMLKIADYARDNASQCSELIGAVQSRIAAHQSAVAHANALAVGQTTTRVRRRVVRPQSA